MEKERKRATLADDLGTLLSSGAAADVTIMADGARLPTHRAVLAARSPVFAAMLRHDVLEVSEGSVRISIPDINQEVVWQLLQFMYTDEMPLMEGITTDLLAAADKYDLPRLKQWCEQQVIQDLCVESAAATAVLAMAYSCSNLKAAAISFINAHYKEVMATDGWATALRKHTEDAVEICRLLGEARCPEQEWESEPLAKTEDTEGSLPGDLLALLDSGDCSDVTLAVGGVSVAAHRAVLAARSSVLAKQLQGCPGGVLQVQGAREEQLRHALRYMYGDLLPPPASVTASLLVLADTCGLCALKDHCEVQLEDKICIDNAVSLAVLAAKHSCSSLKVSCACFIQRDIFKVMETAGWETALRNDVEYMVEISKCVAGLGQIRCQLL